MSMVNGDNRFWKKNVFVLIGDNYTELRETIVNCANTAFKNKIWVFFLGADQ